MYRSRLKDLAYLKIETRSGSYSILDDDFAAAQGWDYGCDYEVVEKFEAPMTLAEMRSDPGIAEWGAFAQGSGARSIEYPRVWDRLLDRLSADPAKTEKRRKSAASRHTLEREIEALLAAEPGRFAPHGFKLDLRATQRPFPRGGRADLIFFDEAADRFVVVELKRDLVGRNAIAQLLSYRASVREQFPAARPPLGLLVGSRLDNEAAGMVEERRAPPIHRPGQARILNRRRRPR